MTTITACAFVLSLALSQAESAAPAGDGQPAAGPVRHLVLFKFKDETTPEETKKLEDGLRALPGKIDVIKDFEWGTNISPEGLAQGFTHAFFLSFDSREGLETYGPHPDHEAFRQLLQPHRDQTLVFDYQPKKVKETPKRDSKGPVRHVVLFKFKDDATPEQVKAVEDAFVALPEKMDLIKGFEWGTSFGDAERAGGYTHCFYLTFANESDRDAYLPHPEHKAFGKTLGPVLDKVLVVDYKAKE